jgi:hypothetical protein
MALSALPPYLAANATTELQKIEIQKVQNRQAMT